MTQAEIDEVLKAYGLKLSLLSPEVKQLIAEVKRGPDPEPGK